MAPPANESVTVVIACYEYGAFLPEAVASALEQERETPHVIVVDDGSTDPGTLAALDALPPQVEVIRQDNRGLSTARNVGLARAQTRYLIALDADDRLAPGALRALSAALDADPQLGFAYGVTRFFGDWDGTLSLAPYDAFALLYRHTIGATALMRREVFRDTGGFDPAFTAYEDWEFWLHALACGWRGRRVPETTLLYRRHGETMVTGARREYRAWYRRLRAKHAPLYARRAELARESGLGPPQRALHRCYWGPRPVPARVEHALYSAVFGRRAASPQQRRDHAPVGAGDRVDDR